MIVATEICNSFNLTSVNPDEHSTDDPKPDDLSFDEITKERKTNVLGRAHYRTLLVCARNISQQGRHLYLFKIVYPTFNGKGVSKDALVNSVSPIKGPPTSYNVP